MAIKHSRAMRTANVSSFRLKYLCSSSDYEKNSNYFCLWLKDKPFYMAKYDQNGTFIKYEGYCVDLAHRISEILNITYELRGVRDKKFGSEGMNSDLSSSY